MTTRCVQCTKEAGVWMEHRDLFFCWQHAFEGVEYAGGDPLPMKDMDGKNISLAIWRNKK